MTPFDLASEFHRAGILQDHFKQVPDDYLALPEGNEGKTRIRCVCEAEIDLSFGQIESCGCGRIFWCGSKIYAAPPPTEDDHDCEAARFTLRGGTTVIADYCAECMGDL